MVQFAVSVCTIRAMWLARVCTTHQKLLNVSFWSFPFVDCRVVSSISFQAAWLKTPVTDFNVFLLFVCDTRIREHGEPTKSGEDKKTFFLVGLARLLARSLSHLSVLFCSSLFCHFFISLRLYLALSSSLFRPLSESQSISLPLSISLGYVLWPNEPSPSVATERIHTEHTVSVCAIVVLHGFLDGRVLYYFFSLLFRRHGKYLQQFAA